MASLIRFAIFNKTTEYLEGEMVKTLICLLILFMTIHAADPYHKELKRNRLNYHEKWLVIIGGAKSHAKARDQKVPDSVKFTVALSTYYRGLNPHWFIAVAKVCDTQEEARVYRDELKAAGINCYYKYSGELIYDRSFYSDLKSGYVPKKTLDTHIGFTNKDSSIILDPINIDPTADSLMIISDGDTIETNCGYTQSNEFLWNEDLQLVASVSEDNYAAQSDRGIFVFDVQTGDCDFYSMEDLRKKSTVDPGRRNHYYIADMAWVNKTTLSFSIYVTFECGSGHPGIDHVLKEELGDDFCKDDPILVGNFAIVVDWR